MRRQERPLHARIWVPSPRTALSRGPRTGPNGLSHHRQILHAIQLGEEAGVVTVVFVFGDKRVTDLEAHHDPCGIVRTFIHIRVQTIE